MARARLIKTSDGISKYIDGFIERGKTVQAYLNRVAYRQYQQAQATRWESENSSETGQWAPLSTRPFFAFWEDPPVYVDGGYAEYKKIKYADFPGGGNALMIATGMLSAAAMGRGEGALKVISGNTMTVGIDDSAIPYGKYAAEKRPFMDFGASTTQTIVDGVAAWIMKGE